MSKHFLLQLNITGRLRAKAGATYLAHTSKLISNIYCYVVWYIRSRLVRWLVDWLVEWLVRWLVG